MEKSGWLNINKPVGWTSTKVVSVLKRLLKPKKIGHGGTLDPFASGVLPICINSATKTVEYMMDHDKTYLFHLTFGSETDTYDIDGKVINKDDKIPTENDILKIIPEFIGKIKQVPPKYSALKINGKRACDIMRDGGEVEIQEREIEVLNLKYNGFVNENTAEFIVDCSRGTYIRTLGVDIAKKLNCLGFISKLTRLRVGDFYIDNSLQIDGDVNVDFIKNQLISINDVLKFDSVLCSDEEIAKLSNGIMIDKDIKENTIYKIIDKNNNVLFLGEKYKNKMKTIKSFH